MAINIRSAREKDQQTIVSFIRQAKLSPRNLDWERFLVAEESGRIIGIRQVKVHLQGTREVASGFVLPEYRRRGISAQLMREILVRETGPLYMMVSEKRTFYYEKFGFQRVAVDRLPPDFKKEYRIGRVVTSLMSIFSKDKIQINSSTVFNGKTILNHTPHGHRCREGHKGKRLIKSGRISSFVYLVPFVVRLFPVNYRRAKLIQ